jgi:hypothetical protein
VTKNSSSSLILQDIQHEKGVSKSVRVIKAALLKKLRSVIFEIQLSIIVIFFALGLKSVISIHISSTILVITSPICVILFFHRLVITLLLIMTSSHPFLYNFVAFYFNKSVLNSGLYYKSFTVVNLLL